MNLIRLLCKKCIEIFSFSVLDFPSDLESKKGTGCLDLNFYRDLILSIALYITAYFFGYLLFYTEFQKYNQSILAKLSPELTFSSYFVLYPFNAMVLIFSLFLFSIFNFLCSYLLFFILDRPKYLAKGLYIVQIKLLEVSFVLMTVLFILNRILSIFPPSENTGFMFLILFLFAFVFFLYKMKEFYGLFFERNPYLIPKRRSHFVCYVFIGICFGLGYGIT